MYNLLDTTTNREIVEYKSLLNLINTYPVTITYDYGKLKKHFLDPVFKRQSLSVLKYKHLYPINHDAEVISLQEGGTPLYKSSVLKKKLGIGKLYFKYEGANPTGAFKDRGTLIEVTKAIEYKSKGIVVASTGNMAASVAAYCARATIPCYVFIPAATPVSKLAQAVFYGAKIIKIEGSYDQAAMLAKKTAEELEFFLAGDYVFRTEGQKSQGYEIIEQLGYQVPDYVYVPTGNGTNIYAIWKGFTEYFQMGLIDKLPRMVAVQSAIHSAIVTSFIQQSPTVLTDKEIKIQKTIASAIAVNNPTDGDKVLEFLYQSKGFAIDVNDEEIIKAQFTLAANESLFVEPSAASALAALQKSVEEGKLDQKSTVVCLLSGCGLKDPLAAAEYFPKEKVIAPEFSAVKEAFVKNSWLL